MAIQVQTAVAQNGNSNTVNIRFTDDGTGSNATERVYIFPGCGDVSNRTLPSTMTLSKDYTVADDYYDFFSKVPCRITSIKFATGSPNDNYNQSLKVGYATPSQENIKLNSIDLDQYATTIGDNYAETLVLGNLNWLTLPNFLAYVDIKKGTYLDIRMEIDQMTQSADLLPIQF